MTEIKCPKCSCTGIDQLYIAQMKLEDIKIPEFIRLSCKQCSYVWAVHTEDVKL